MGTTFYLPNLAIRRYCYLATPLGNFRRYKNFVKVKIVGFYVTSSFEMAKLAARWPLGENCSKMEFEKFSCCMEKTSLISFEVSHKIDKFNAIYLGSWTFCRYDYTNLMFLFICKILTGEFWWECSAMWLLLKSNASSLLKNLNFFAVDDIWYIFKKFSQNVPYTEWFEFRFTKKMLTVDKKAGKIFVAWIKKKYVKKDNSSHNQSIKSFE